MNDFEDDIADVFDWVDRVQATEAAAKRVRRLEAFAATLLELRGADTYDPAEWGEPMCSYLQRPFYDETMGAVNGYEPA